jgi:hypothetical protein
VNSGFEDILAEMETLEPVRNSQVSGRRFTEPGNTFHLGGYRIVARGLPVRKRTVCVEPENEAFLHVHDDRFLFLDRCQFPMPNI